MINDLEVITSTLTDGSKVFAVEFTPLMPEGIAPVKLTFHCYDRASADRLATVLDGAVCGVNVDPR